MKVLKSFDERCVKQLTEVHGRITVPVQLVWGDQDPFFPLAPSKSPPRSSPS